jgi:penicillin amidase
MEEITPEDMQRMQMDTYSYYAEILLPSLLKWVQTDSLTDEELEVYNLVTEWNYYMDAEEIAPSVFRSWRGHFYRSIFYDEYETTPAMLRYPARDRFAEVIKEEPNWPFIDNIETDEIETREQQATNSFKTAILELTEEHGEFGDNWKWGYAINNDINHLAFIPGMGEQDLFTSGSSEAINATRGTHGPSWRMVVEVGQEVRGYGVYPGGQSGNPGSNSYTEFIEPWRTGELFELKFLREKPELSENFPLIVTME